MKWLTSLWRKITSWFSPPRQGALAVMKELQTEKKTSHPDWDRNRRRLATLVFSKADQQRLWRRAHRSGTQSARLLSGIVAPTPDETQVLEELIRELESGR